MGRCVSFVSAVLIAGLSASTFAGEAASPGSQVTITLNSAQRGIVLRNEIKRLQNEIESLKPKAVITPTTLPDAAQLAARERIGRAIGEMTKKTMELKELEQSFRAPMMNHTTPDRMPPGAQPRDFNGFTYYIVPLG